MRLPLRLRCSYPDAFAGAAGSTGACECRGSITTSAPVNTETTFGACFAAEVYGTSPACTPAVPETAAPEVEAPATEAPAEEAATTPSFSEEPIQAMTIETTEPVAATDKDTPQ